MKIAFLEDDPDQIKLINYWLTKAGHDVIYADNAVGFIATAIDFGPDMILLDMELPTSSGLDVLIELRQKHLVTSPIIFYSSNAGEEYIINALQNGANDYLAKPLSEQLFLLRIDAIERRLQIVPPVEKHQYHYNNFIFDTRNRQVVYLTDDIKLTQKEFEIAHYLRPLH